MSLISLEIFIFVSVLSFSEGGKIVCKDISDYYSKKSADCYFNADIGAPLEVIAKNHGYFMENIILVTKEGYILDVYHLVQNSNDVLNNRPPILMQHGILTNAGFFMGIGNQSLAFVLVNKGYDVWLSNYRTILRPKGNVNMTSTNPKYYDFSYHEMALEDLPVIIDYIKEHNKSPEKLLYLGHSMGTTMGYIYSSLKPDEAQKNLKALINLASFAFTGESRSAFFTTGLVSIVSALFQSIYPIEYIYEKFVVYTGNIVSTFCYDLKMMEFCKLVVDQFFGFDKKQFQAEYFPNLIYNVKGWLPEVIVDFSKLRKSGRFIGKDRKSKSSKYIDYPLEKIRVPVYIFQSENDAAAVVKDGQIMASKLVNTKRKLIIIDKDSDVKFGHVDMLFGRHVDILYKQLFQELDQI